MAKKVKYNGQTKTYYVCSDFKLLTKGKVYEVDKEIPFGKNTKYVLKGIHGEFNSTWFDIVSQDDTVYTAIANHIPIIGQKYQCYKIDMINGKPRLTRVLTSEVKNFKCIGNNIYIVNTEKGLYIVTIG